MSSGFSLRVWGRGWGWWPMAIMASTCGIGMDAKKESMGKVEMPICSWFYIGQNGSCAPAQHLNKHPQATIATLRDGETLQSACVPLLRVVCRQSHPTFFGACSKHRSNQSQQPCKSHASPRPGTCLKGTKCRARSQELSCTNT